MTTVHIEKTNKPTIVKFVFNRMFTDGAFEFNSLEDAKDSPLAQQLFKLPFIKKVYVSANFIALERFDMLEWEDVQNDLAEILKSYFDQGKELFKTETDEKQVVEVYAEETPNPLTQKFVVNRFLTNQLIEVKNIQEAQEVPLAKELFSFPFIKEVFITQNYISLTRDYTEEWFAVNKLIRKFIKDYLGADKEVVTENYKPKPAVSKENEILAATDDEISKQIIGILDEYIKPAVAGDGGNIMFQSYNQESKVVNVILQGACNGCPSSTITLKNGIEATLKQFLPGKIEAVNALN